MDLQPLLDFSGKRKKSLLLIAAVGFSTYGLYRLYHSPSISKKRKTVLKLFRTLLSISDAVSYSAESIRIFSRDLKLFLQSDSDEIPNSLKQISKIARSDEFSASLVSITEAMTVGMLRGYQSESKIELQSETGASFSDKLLEKVVSTAGSGFASVVVGSFARSLVLAFFSKDEPNSNLNYSNLDVNSLNNLDSNSGTRVPGWVNVLCSDKCRELIGESIRLFVSTAVAVYLDKTMNINTYDEIFTGLTNPKHESKVKEMLVSVCNSTVETLVKTSHQVLTGSHSNSKLSSHSNSSSDFDAASVDSSQGSILNAMQTSGQKEFSESLNERLSDEMKDRGWVGRVSSTLAVPSNRKFILDMTGRVTFETVRSFLEFSLWKVLDGLKRSTIVVSGKAVERGVEFMRYIGARSVVIATICLALCLHVLVGTRALVPA